MKEFIPLQIAVLTVSDTRNYETDKSGGFLKEAIVNAEHELAGYDICVDDKYQIRSIVSRWIADAAVDVILVTGGTGFTDRDITPDAVSVLFDKTIEGFGELFRRISYDEIGTSTVQSRAIAGLANETFIFVLPGSTGACKTAWHKILLEQLDSRHRPCNFADLINTGVQHG